MNTIKSLLIFGSMALTSLCHANEPLWTPQQRQENRSHVAEANILDTKRLNWKSHSDDTFWKEATIQIKKTIKGEFRIMKIYYLSSDEGDKRCPPLPNLVKNKFYILHCNEQIVEGENRLVLSLSSDATLMTEDNDKPAAK